MSKNVINIDLFADSLFELARMDAEIRKDMLQECGYNAEEVEARGIQLIRKLKFQAIAAAKKQRFQALYQNALNSFKQLKEDSKLALMEMLSKRGITLQYRNIENFETEDLQQILDEATILEIMEKIDKGDL